MLQASQAALVDVLKQEIEFLKEQIKFKDEQILRHTEPKYEVSKSVDAPVIPGRRPWSVIQRELENKHKLPVVKQDTTEVIDTELESHVLSQE